MTDLLSETAARLRVQVPEVLARWADRVLRQVPAASTVETGELHDHLHILLEQVVIALSPDAPEGATYRLTISERHGRERALLESYSLGEVLQEYSILRRTVLEVLEEGRPMSQHERTVINDALEKALIGASTQYALVQQDAERKRGDEARAAFQRERRITEALQRPLLLRVAEDAFQGLSLATFYEPLKPEAEVGGDFLDAFAVPGGKVALVLGDACGKGLEAAIHNTLLKEVLRAFLREDSSRLGHVVARLNDVICDTLLQDVSHDQGRFIILSLAVIDPVSGETLFAVGGAEPPLILRANGESDAVDVRGMPLGIEAGQPYEERRRRLAPGDTLLMVTDGITEARSGGRLLGYGGMSRLAEEALRAPSLDDAGKAILEGARAAAGGALQDDACLILARKR